MTSRDIKSLLNQASRVLNARDLKAQVDLVTFAAGFARLRPCGRQFVGLCPLHSERNPSFYVHPVKQVFKCFGCGVGGDIFVFVMRATGCGFRRALEVVAEFSDGVARAEPRSGSRFGASEGAKPLSPPKAGASHSQSSQDLRARTLATLEVANRRLRAIEATNRAASAALATACEPERGGEVFLLDNCVGWSSIQRVFCSQPTTATVFSRRWRRKLRGMRSMRFGNAVLRRKKRSAYALTRSQG